MKRKIRVMITALLALALMLVMGSCGKSEPQEVTGKLINAVEKQLTVSTDDGAIVFKTADDTVYNLGDQSELCIGDTITVKYHKSLGKDHVDEVTLVEHFEPELIFDGTAIEVTDKGLTVKGKSLTVAFTRDADTTVEGDLKAGAEVEIIYTGDLSEYPYATEVKVTKEAPEPEKKEEEKPKTATVSGIVAEFTEKTMLLSIDSATSYRFTLGKDFKVTGAAKYVHTGDSVNVTYKGELSKSPEVIEINIVKVAQPERRKVDGTITGVEKDYLTLNTGKKVYIIHTDKNTKYTGDKPAKGCKAEVTYTGNLSKDALATNIYCVKSEPKKVIFNVTFTDGAGNTISTQTVEKGKAATAPKDPLREGYTFKGWDKDFSKVMSDLTVSAVWEKNKEPEPEPEPEPEKEVTSEGTITKWTGDGDNSFTLKLKDGSEITLEAGDFTEIASGYFPAVDDKIKVTYLKSDMKALKIELIEKAASKEDGDDEGKDDSGEETDPSTEPEEKTEPEPEPEPAPAEEPEEQTEPEPEPEPAPAEEPEEAEEAEPEPEPEPVPEPEPKEEPDIVVSADKVTIVEGNESKKTFTFLDQQGNKITLSVDGDSKIASGYFPEKDDVVSIKYTKKGMQLKEISLVSRPEPPAPEESAEG